MKKQTLISIILVIIAFIVILYIYYGLYINAQEPSIRIIGRIEDCGILLEHQGGKSLNENTVIIFTIAGVPYNFNLLDSEIDLIASDGSDGKLNQRWDIGESIYYYNESYGLCDDFLPNIEVKVVDGVSKNLIFVGTFIEG